MAELERAIMIATEAHNDQRDKSGAPYILHPLRVMSCMSTTESRIVAVLHDVAEDCPWWLVDKLAHEFGPLVGASLDAITKRKGESYDAYLSRIETNPVALEVKLADLKDNSDMTRLAGATDKDWERYQKYQLAMSRLMETQALSLACSQ